MKQATDNTQLYMTVPETYYHIDIGFAGVYAHYRATEYLSPEAAERAAGKVQALSHYLRDGSIYLESLENITKILEELREMGFYMVNNETKQLYESEYGMTVTC